MMILALLLRLEPVVPVIAIGFRQNVQERRFFRCRGKRADPSKQSVPANHSAGFLRKLADGVRMLVRAGRTQGKLAQDRKIRV